MAAKTKAELRNQVMYSVYVRNYSEEGTFAAVERDLDRIKALGTDIIWFMPIHPVGEKAKKGELGSPYANKDYRAINPEFGTMEDFKSVVNAIHEKGMKCKFAANRNRGYFILFIKYSVFSLSTYRKKYRIKLVRKMKLFA